MIRSIGITMIVVLSARTEAANGQCTVPSDCEVTSANCVNMSCTIATPRELFPDVSGLTEIELSDPAQLGKVNATPEFHWVQPVGVDVIFVAVMPIFPAYTDRVDRISNFFTAVWVWNSTLPGGSASSTSARFSEGRALSPDSTPGNEILTEGPPPPLPAGVYYWGVWAWTGTQLTHRSIARTFVVGSENITGRTCLLCDGAAALRCVNEVYCIIACASDVDCYQGMTCDLSNLTPDHQWGICRTSPASCACDAGKCDPDLQVCIDDRDAGCSGDDSNSCQSTNAPGAVILFVATVVLIMRRRRRAPMR